MIYMLKVNVLVAAVVFGLAGVFILLLFAWTEAKKYAHALCTMGRIVAATRREPVAISRVNSRNRNANSRHHLDPNRIPLGRSIARSAALRRQK